MVITCSMLGLGLVELSEVGPEIPVKILLLPTAGRLHCALLWCAWCHGAAVIS
jgi:hypothetical protein